MGRTVPTYRRQLEQEHQRWLLFRAALRTEDQPIFDALFQHSRDHADAGSAAARACPSEALFMSILVGLCKEVLRLRKILDPPCNCTPETVPQSRTSRHMNGCITAAPRNLLSILPYPHLKH